MIGQRISHYKVLEKLGEGGMGVVYKAEDTKLKRTVALKFLPAELMSDQGAKKRFLHEAQAAAAIEHQNICNIYEIDEVEGKIFIVMNCIEGQDLKEKIDAGPLNIDEVLKIAVQTVEGLLEAHEKGTIHRDIKSANIMVNEKGQVKILDFGLAKLKGQSRLTKAGFRLGTASYMSPEQIQGEDIDQRSDIWSFGVVLYEMISGQLPFKGEYEHAVVYSIMNENPEPLTAFRTGVPTELEQIVNKALTKDPSRRYQNMDELTVDLRNLKSDSKPEVTPAKIKTSPGITIKASRKSIFLGSIILAVVLIVAGFFIFKDKPESEIPGRETGGKPSLAVVYFENNSGDAKLDNWRSAFSELLTTDLSQSKYIRVLRSDEIYGIFKKLNLLEAQRYSTDYDLKNVAGKGGVNHILKGSYIKAGEHFKITAMLFDANTGETISSLSVKAEGEKEIFAKVDELTKKIKTQLNISSSQIADDIDGDIGQITSASSEALNYYIEGRKYDNSGEFDKSIKLMEKAVAIDPQFAMAYRSMAASYGNQELYSKKEEYLRRALEYSHRLSAKERYIISGDFYLYVEGDAEKAVTAFEKILELYPGDNWGHTKLGEVYQLIGEWEKAIGHYEECRKNGDRSVYSYTNLSWLYGMKKLYHKAEEVLKEYLANYGSNLSAHVYLSFTYVIQRKFDLARAETEKMFAIDPTYLYIPLFKGDIYYFKDRLKEARKEYIKLRNLGGFDAKFYGLLRLAQLNLVQGKIKKSREFVLKQIDASKRFGLLWHTLSFRVYAYSLFKAGDFKQSAKQFNRVWDAALQERNAIVSRYHKKYALLGKGLIYLELDAPEQALQAAKKLKALAKKGLVKRNIAAYYYLIGMIELKQKKFDRAARNLVQAIRILSNNFQTAFYSDFSVMVVDRLAAAYLSNGHLEKARESYEQILSMTYDRIEHGDIYAKSYYHLGKIYRQKGMKEEAVKHYNKFIQLWQECDPQFRPLLEDAQKQVALLGK